MQVDILNRRVLVQRHLVALVAVPVLLCVTLIAWGAVAIADVEFTRAVGVSDTVWLPRITQVYRMVYHWWWCGPIVGAIWLIFLLYRKTCSLGVLVSLVQFLAVFLVVWLAFAVVGFYGANVTLWGWRRVVVGHDVFVDRGIRPGQEPLVPGGDDLLPGELYSGKWDGPGVENILRRVVGTYRKEEAERNDPDARTGE